MILIAPDKFKGHMTAADVCRFVDERLRRAGYNGEIQHRPLSDGGEGVANMLMPDSRPGDVPGIYFSPDGGKCLAVSSEIVGFEAFAGTDIPLMQRSSIALGRAIPRGIPVTVAVGGTAISDGGAGFLQGLGVRFFDSCHRFIEEPLCPATLHTVIGADLSALGQYRLSGVIDVKASLIPSGSSTMLSALDFASQKALPDENLSDLQEALTHLKNVLGGDSPWDGAGGGLGYALASVAGARCSSGAEAAARSLCLDWEKVNLIVTGEGRVDRQTSRGGKLVDAIYNLAKAHNVPVLILYGAADSEPLYPYMAQIDSDWAADTRRFWRF